MLYPNPLQQKIQPGELINLLYGGSPLAYGLQTLAANLALLRGK